MESPSANASVEDIEVESQVPRCASTISAAGETVTNPSSILLSLPPEMIEWITRYLYARDLENFVLSSKHIFRLSQKAFKAHQEVMKISYWHRSWPTGGLNQHQDYPLSTIE